MNWWINVIVAPSIFVLRRPILSTIRRKRASSSFGGAVILVSGVDKIVTSQEHLLILSLSFLQHLQTSCIFLTTSPSASVPGRAVIHESFLTSKKISFYTNILFAFLLKSSVQLATSLSSFSSAVVAPFR